MTDAITLAKSPRSVWQAMGKGARHKCPSCGEGAIFRKFLKISDTCGHCGEELHHHRADDAPPYFTIFIVGHIIVPLVLWVEMNYHPDMTMQIIVWSILTLVLSLITLPIVKGAVVGLQWALRMHGFGGHEEWQDH